MKTILFVLITFFSSISYSQIKGIDYENLQELDKLEDYIEGRPIKIDNYTITHQWIDVNLNNLKISQRRISYLLIANGIDIEKDGSLPYYMEKWNDYESLYKQYLIKGEIKINWQLPNFALHYQITPKGIFNTIITVPGFPVHDPSIEYIKTRKISLTERLQKGYKPESLSTNYINELTVNAIDVDYDNYSSQYERIVKTPHGYRVIFNGNKEGYILAHKQINQILESLEIKDDSNNTIADVKLKDWSKFLSDFELIEDSRLNYEKFTIFIGWEKDGRIIGFSYNKPKNIYIVVIEKAK